MSKTVPQKPEVPLSTFAFLFAEIVHYHQQHTTTIEELEARLHAAGMSIGKRYLEMVGYRQGVKNLKLENNAVSSLHFIYATFWKSMFGRTATGLVKGNDGDSELYLIESEPITNKFVSVPRNFGDINCASFLAGMINGAMLAKCIDCTVAASWDEAHTQTVFVVKILQPLPKG
jgi:hypothetical protein